MSIEPLSSVFGQYWARSRAALASLAFSSGGGIDPNRVCRALPLDAVPERVGDEIMVHRRPHGQSCVSGASVVLATLTDIQRAEG